MFKKLLLASALLWPTALLAQAPVFCPTRPVGDNTNACASTAFVLQNGGSGGAVSSVSNSDGTLTVAPTTGAVVTGLNLAHVNVWTGAQTFPAVTVKPASGNSFVSIDTPGTGTQAGFNLYDNGVAKWQFIRQTDDSFLISDVTAAQTVATFSPAGVININPSAGHGVTIGTGVTDPGSPGILAATSFKSSLGTVVSTIASGALALSTTAIASATCSAAQTATATGTLTTDVVQASFNGDPTGATGYIPSTSGMLTIIPYPTANTVNFKVCNNTTASITPGAVTINWRVAR